METTAILITEPGKLSLAEIALDAPTARDVVVDVAWSSVSTGTEKLLWTGAMPPFPGLGYPLVPGYESVGEVVDAGPEAGLAVGQHVFVPGATCFGEIRGLFGGSARRLVVPGARVAPIDSALGAEGTLLALAATAQHAIAGGVDLPDLIIGHGVLGRMIARLVVAKGTGDSPTVWEIDPARQGGAEGYRVVHPDDDTRRDYRAICDVSGDASLVDGLIGRLARGGELVLAGFYADRIGFAFPPAFIKEARIRIAAEWSPADLGAVRALVESGRLSLDGLITHRRPAQEADAAYPQAFTDPACLKMTLDWRH